MNAPHPDHRQPAGQDGRPGVGQGAHPGSGATATGSNPRAGRPAPTRSNSSVVIATLIAVVVITGGLAAWLLSSPSYDRTTADGTAEAFADAVNARNVDAVQQLVCSRDRYDINSSGSELLRAATLTLIGVDTSGNAGTADYRIQASVASEEVSLPLQRDATTGEWSVCPSGSGQ